MRDLRSERFSDLSPEQLHQQQQRFAAAMGEGIASVLGDDASGFGGQGSPLFPAIPHLTLQRLPQNPAVQRPAAPDSAVAVSPEKLT